MPGRKAILSWHIAQTKPGLSALAESSIQRLGYKPFNPKVVVRRTWSRGRVHLSTKQYIPGYIFVQFDCEVDERWPLINDQPGVRGLMYSDLEVPARIAQSAMQVLLDQCSGQVVPQQEEVDTRLFALGSGVRITGGPMAGFTGTITELHAKRLVVLTTLFGRATPIGLAKNQVELTS